MGIPIAVLTLFSSWEIARFMRASILPHWYLNRKYQMLYESQSCAPRF